MVDKKLNLPCMDSHISVGRSDLENALGTSMTCGVVGRPALFDLLFLSTPTSPVGSSLPIAEANIFADALGVAPVYRQKESKRWSSALQLYRQMSNHELAEHGGRAVCSGASGNVAANGLMESAAQGAEALNTFHRGLKCPSPKFRSQSSLSNMLCHDDGNVPTAPRVNSGYGRGTGDGSRTPSRRSPPRDGAYRDRSQDTSTEGSPGESSLNSLELEAIAAVHELHFAVRDISVSDLLPRTSELIFLNVTTLEGQAYCVELTAKGWRVTSLRHDCMNGDLAHLDLHTIYFETIYSLMDTISACYRQRFTDLLALRLRQLQALSGSSNQLVQVPEEKDRVADRFSPSVQQQPENRSADPLLLTEDIECGVPITINIRRSSSADMKTLLSGALRDTTGISRCSNKY